MIAEMTASIGIQGIEDIIVFPLILMSYFIIC